MRKIIVLVSILIYYGMGKDSKTFDEFLQPPKKKNHQNKIHPFIQ